MLGGGKKGTNYFAQMDRFCLPYSPNNKPVFRFCNYLLLDVNLELAF